MVIDNTKKSAVLNKAELIMLALFTLNLLAIGSLLTVAKHTQLFCS
jgi:hypothetical protein